MAEPMGFYTDTTVCIGCKACEVACQEWNDLLGMDATSEDTTVQLGTYQTQPDLTATFWIVATERGVMLRLNDIHVM